MKSSNREKECVYNNYLKSIPDSNSQGVLLVISQIDCVHQPTYTSA